MRLFDVTRLSVSVAALALAGVAVAQDAPAADAVPAPNSAEARADGQPGSFPLPDIASDAWQLELDADLPRVIAVEDNRGVTRWYWYLKYQVTNPTDQDRLFIPEVTVVTDNGTIVEAGRGVPARVYPAVAAELRNPLLESPQEIIGTLRQGEDFARESVAIWPVPAEDVDRFTVFFSGLSGESAKLIRPSTGEPLLEQALDPATGDPMFDEQGNPVMREVIARRTTALTYATPGTPASPQQQTIRLLDEGQVMR